MVSQAKLERIRQKFHSPWFRKINRAYYSIFEYLVLRENWAAIHSYLGYYTLPRFFNTTAAKLFSNEYKSSELGWDEVNNRRHQRQKCNPYKNDPVLFGILQPFVDIAKDAVSTFDSYKSKRHIGWDFLQPLRGIGNILKALATVAALPIFLVAGTIDALIPHKHDQITHEASGRGLEYPLSTRLKIHFTYTLIFWPLSALTTLFRGVTQVVTTPLSWIKIMARGSSSAINGWQKLEDDRGVRRLLAEVDQPPENQYVRQYYFLEIEQELKRKYEHAKVQGRNCENIPVSEGAYHIKFFKEKAKASDDARVLAAVQNNRFAQRG